MTTYQSENPTPFPFAPIQKPAQIAESRLIEAILNGSYPINSRLPGERELAAFLGVTRPTLREALQRLASDGWVEIHQGKPTRVRDYWKEGKLGVLNTLSEHPGQLPENFIPNLLSVRLAMAPTYTGLAVANAPEEVVLLLDGRHKLNNSPAEYAQFDWNIQHQFTLLSENPVFIMILNGFMDMFLNLAPAYFSIPAARQHSHQYYTDMAQAAQDRNVERAEKLTGDIMRESLNFWAQTKFY